MSKTGLVIANCSRCDKKPTIYRNQPVFGIFYEQN